MGKWKRFLSMLLTAVICLAMGLVPGKRVSAGTVQDGAGVPFQEEACLKSRNFREMQIQNHNENGLNLQNEAVAGYDSGTGFFRKNVFYRMRGPDDRRDLYFEDSG